MLIGFLMKMYYRLYVHNKGETSSQYRLFPDDPSLSLINIDWVQPPGRANEYKHYICAREGIDPSRVTLYHSRIDSWELIPNDALIVSAEYDLRKPLGVLIELEAGMSMDDADRPLPSYITSLRYIGSCFRACLPSCH